MTPRDRPALQRIYDHYVRETPATFDIEPTGPQGRADYYRQFAGQGRYRMMVAVAGDQAGDAGAILGYAASVRYMARAAYDRTVMVSIFLAPGSTGRGLGTRLYQALFEALSGEEIHQLVAGITLPNPASEALHARFGFTRCGLFREVGWKFGRYWDVAWYERAFPRAPGRASATAG